MVQDYILLRKGNDLDCFVKRSNLQKVLKNFEEKNFIKNEKRHNSIHLKKIYPKYQDYHLYIGGISYNKINVFEEKYFFEEKEISEFISLLLHLIIDKESLNGKRNSELFLKFSSIKNKNKLFEILEKEYGKNISRKISLLLEKEKINFKRLKWQIIIKKASLFQLVFLPFILASNQIHKLKKRKKRYIISFIGVDGSGKTTSIKILSEYLSKNGFKNRIGNLGVYHERSKFLENLSFFMKKEKTKTRSKEKLNINYKRKSTLKNILRIIDLYLRYRKTLRLSKRNKEKIIIFDRYFYDLILQSKIDFLTKILLKLSPKPDKLFFLYSNPREIFERKKERTPQVLKEQTIKFKREIKGICKIKEIETISKKQTKEEILKELNNKKFFSKI